MPVIAVTNYKGGVGKTTTSLNLAAALQQAGKRVLVVDLDPQANLTIYAGFKEIDSLGRTLSEVMRDYVSGRRGPSLELDEAVRTLPNGLDLLPCNRHLVHVEQGLLDVEGRERVLSAILLPLRDRYDFIVIDCLPGAGLLSVNALTAADYVIVPVQAEYLAMQGLAHLLQAVAQVRATFNPRLQVLGVLMTMVDLRTLHSREILDAIRRVFQSEIRVFYSMIKIDVKLRESTKAGQTILDYAPSSRGAEAYQSLAREILAILPDYEQDPERGSLSDLELVTRVAETESNLELKALANGHSTVAIDDETPVLASTPVANGRGDASAAATTAPVFVCPRLGLASQPDQRGTAPSAEHRCFAMNEPLNLSLKRQQSLCLTDRHRECPLFVRYTVFAAEEARRRQEAEAGGRGLRRFFGGLKLFGR